MLTSQEVFNTVSQHLLTMPHRAAKRDANNITQCQYLAPDGSKCAVGVLLTDEEAHRADLLSTDVFGLKHKGALPADLIPHVSLLSRLQNVHDDPSNWISADRERMKRSLDFTAEEYQLEFNPDA